VRRPNNKSKFRNKRGGGPLWCLRYEQDGCYIETTERAHTEDVARMRAAQRTGCQALVRKEDSICIKVAYGN